MSAWGVSRFAVLGILLWTALARGGVHGWPLAIGQLLTLFALGAWLWAMLRQGTLEWRRTALDVPLGLMFLLILVQLALGNGSLREWALAPPTAPPEFTAEPPSRFWFLGTVAPVHTRQALAVFAMYAAVYVLTVNVIRERRQLQSFIRTMLIVGAALAFAGLLDYVVGESWVLPWKEMHGEGRVRGTFNNPDHFATWLTMLVCLGVGTLAANRSRRRDTTPIAVRLTSRHFREHLVRRYLPFLGIVMAALALVFTLSRGGIVGLLAGLGIMFLLFGRLGWMRWNVVLIGVFGVVTLIYASWIGFGPLVARLQPDQSRWLLFRATLPMLSAFPVFGIGLGTYGDIFFRYQTPALEPGRVYVSDAHNDWLQLVAETGFLGAVIAGYMVWRLARDLVQTHLFGRGACPVGGGEGELGQRRDSFSIGIAVGALGAAFGCGVHCLVEFPVRIPANGVFAAACLGIATVALHTRFDRQARLLVDRWSWSCGDRRMIPVALRITAAVVGVVLASWIVSPARIESALAPREGTTDLARIEAALTIDPSDPGSRALRGEAHLITARESAQVAVVRSAVADLRAALAAVPTDAFVHQRLGWAYEVLSALDLVRASDHVASAVAHLKRAVAMAPGNALLHHSVAAVAITHPATLHTIGLAAARAAVARDPDLLPDLVERIEPSGLRAEQWLSVVPAEWPARLELAQLLDMRGQLGAAEVVYRAAIDLAPPGERAAGLWMLASLLTRNGDPSAAARQIQTLLVGDPHNPELLMVYGQALETQGNPVALDVYRAAAAHADAVAQDGRAPPFKSDSPRIRALVGALIGAEAAAVRHRRMLGRYLIEHELWSQAGYEWDRILSQSPKDVEAHFARGVAWEGAGAPDRALEHYREAVALGAQPRFRLSLARLLWDKEQYVQAMNEWRAVLATEPNNVEARLGLARAHLKEGDRLAAYHQFQGILTRVPDHPVARREVARLTGALR